MKQNLSSDEIYLSDFLQILWKNKFIIISFVIFSVLAMYTFQYDKNPKKITAKTEIINISIYDEEKYKIYNFYLDSVKPYYLINGIRKLEIKEGRNIILSITNINKTLLLDLFIDKLKNQDFVYKNIVNSEIFEEIKFKNKLEIERLATELASSIEIYKDDKLKSFVITAQITEIEKWNKFLKYIEKKINLEVQKELDEMFTNFVSYVESIRNFELEDIENQLTFYQDETKKSVLLSKKSILIKDNYINRLKLIFENSPIGSLDSFYAAKILVNETNYQYETNRMKFNLILTGILALLIISSTLLIVNVIQNQRKNKIS